MTRIVFEREILKSGEVHVTCVDCLTDGKLWAPTYRSYTRASEAMREHAAIRHMTVRDV